jgi:hypothetical protein
MNKQINKLIEKYENRIENKKIQQIYNQNDIVEGIILTLEQVVEDLKNLPKNYKEEI